MERSLTNVHIVGKDCLGSSASCIMDFLLCKLYCAEKILQWIWERFLYEKNRNYNFSKLVPNSLLFLFFFYRNHKQESDFQKVGCLETRSSFHFAL